MEELTPRQGFGLIVVMIAILGICGVFGGIERDTLTLEQGIYISIALVIIIGAGALLINFKEDKQLHKSNKKARKVGKPNRAKRKIIQDNYKS